MRRWFQGNGSHQQPMVGGHRAGMGAFMREMGKMWSWATFAAPEMRKPSCVVRPDDLGNNYSLDVDEDIGKG